MYGFQELTDDAPALEQSPLVMAIAKTLEYTAQNGGIELTKSGAFKRSFVNWAAAEFRWPRFTVEELFRFNKVLNENDFYPLAQLHSFLLCLKIARHFKGTFQLTKAGMSLVGHPAQIFAKVAETYIFDVVHSGSERHDSGGAVPWKVILNTLNLEAENGITSKLAGELFYPKPDPPSNYHFVSSDAYVAILRPLCWLGFLYEHPHPDIRQWDQSVFTKTALWKAALKLPTDDLIQAPTMH